MPNPKPKTQRKARKPHWNFDGLYIWDRSIVGTCEQAPNGYWYGYGCLDDWQDTPLGSFDEEAQAKKAVQQWVKENCE